jgi:hypothetical protein
VLSAVRCSLLFAGSLVSFGVTAEAQAPAAIREKLRAIGFGPSLEPSMAIYEPLRARALKGDLLIHTEDELLGREILAFIQEGAARQRENSRAR